MEFIDAYLGETFALVCALTWAVAVVLFRKSGETVHPIALNLYKSILAAILLVPTILIIEDELFRDVPLSDYLIALLSGAIGIGLADTVFFKSLNRLGAGLSAVVQCLYSPFIILLSSIWLTESMSTQQALGTALIVSAVLTAVSKPEDSSLTRRAVLVGLLWGASYLFANAVGIVMVKPLLDRSPLLWVTEVRILGGILVLLPLIYFHPKRREMIKTVYAARGWGYTLAGSFVGSYLAMILWLAGMKYTQASIAAALNQTATIFIFILATIFLKEKLTTLRVVGVVLGVAGALLVMFG